MATTQHYIRETVDAATASLLAQLQLDDLEQLASISKGKSRSGDLSDAELARELYRLDLETLATIASDRRMTESIALAVRLDGPSISTEIEIEDIAAQDHNLVQELSGSQPAARLPTEQDGGSLDEETLEKLAALYVALPSDSLDAEADPGEASSNAPHRGPRQLDRRCVACHEQHKFFDVARVACGHEYCRTCIQELFHHALIDESLLPLRCCRQRIEPASVKLFVPLQLIKRVEQKQIEVETPNRTYCHVRHCSSFIAAQHVHNDIATCPSCGEATCITCKGAAHGGDCPLDRGLQQTLELATEQGWQRCPRCWTAIELDQGCYHMTCRCRAEFCYLCAEPWKTCGCEQWDPVRLRRRAVQLIDRNQVAATERTGDAVETQNAEPPNREEAPPVHPERVEPAAEIQDAPNPGPYIAQEVRAAHYAREQMVQRAMANLEENHDCEHDRWRWVQGPHQCEECLSHLPEYIFECRQCRVQACNRCRRNRL